MGKPKRTVFSAVGWVVWKLLSLFGVKYAKDRLARSDGSGRRR